MRRAVTALFIFTLIEIAILSEGRVPAFFTEHETKADIRTSQSERESQARELLRSFGFPPDLIEQVLAN